MFNKHYCCLFGEAYDFSEWNIFGFLDALHRGCFCGVICLYHRTYYIFKVDAEIIMKTHAFSTSDYSLETTFSPALDVKPIKQLLADSVAPSELPTLKQDQFLSQQLAMKSNEQSLDPLIAKEFSESADLKQEYHMLKNRYDQAAGLAKTFEGKVLTPDEQKMTKKLNHEVHVLHQKVESIRWQLQQASVQLKQAQQSSERIREEKQ